MKQSAVVTQLVIWAVLMGVVAHVQMLVQDCVIIVKPVVIIVVTMIVVHNIAKDIVTDTAQAILAK